VKLGGLLNEGVAFRFFWGVFGIDGIIIVYIFVVYFGLGGFRACP
jgi:hypothetical protein